MAGIPTSVFYRKAQTKYIVVPAGDQSDASIESDEEREKQTPDYEGRSESAGQLPDIGPEVEVCDGEQSDTEDADYVPQPEVYCDSSSDEEQFTDTGVGRVVKSKNSNVKEKQRWKLCIKAYSCIQ
ncbi:hypothetical protein EOD39_10819 [Acipenser ruthenus]|uniref:Uncharacterized protein n=1 Tax=Acipenser ruthenus TaxID=7906 RepID=A0A662YV57_ACIRT|nr:hypothetical protein EOD39_10819 [Acipenser ruthenus]